VRPRAWPVLALTGALAFAGEPPASWSEVQRAQVDESIDGDQAAAVRRYEDLVHNRLTTGDPNLSDALYWLAAARWSLGDLKGARDALDQCIRSGVNKGRCIDLRSHIDLEEDSVRVTPLTWAFDTEDHGFFHPREDWDHGSIRIVKDGDGSVLSWTTQVDPLVPDKLVVGFRNPSPAPTTMRLTATSMSLSATLEITLVDAYGHVFAPRPATWVLAQGVQTSIEFRLDSTTDTAGAGAKLVPSQLHRLIVRDITGRYGNVGSNEIRVDAFTVR
jgi:hypothetical protein